MHYGLAPQVIQDKVEVDLVKDKVEMCIYQYLPIKMAGALENFHIPQNLEWIKRFIPHLSFCPHTDFIYVSAKHQFVTPDNMGNRPGWHSDGFGSDDINYIWSDSFPTQFALQEFEISEDHVKSLQELQDQVKEECITDYGIGAFIRIDRWNIHRPPVQGAGFRTFLKFSISKNRYNLQGNSHNYLMNYEWEMLPRSEIRNHPTAVIEPLTKCNNPLNSLIQFTSARKSMGFEVSDLVAQFIKKGVVEVPIGASADSYAELELNQKTLTVEFMLRNVLLKRYPELSGYRNTMTATNKVIADLVATKLFVETKGRSAVPFLHHSENTPAWRYPLSIRDVKCLRLVDWNAAQQ